MSPLLDPSKTFLSTLFLVSLSHHGSFLLFREPFVLFFPSGFRLRSFDTMSEPDLSYLKELCGLMLCSVAGFCRLNTTGRWSLPCAVFALSHGAVLGETRTKSVVLSVPLVVIQGVLITELSLDRRRRRPRLLPEVATHYNCVPKVIFCLFQKSQLTSVDAVPGCMDVLTRTRLLCLWSGFSRRTPCSS